MNSLVQVLRRAEVAGRPSSPFIAASAQRLGWFALLAACPPVVLIAIDALLVELGKPPLGTDPSLSLIARAAIAFLSLAMFAIARDRRVSPEHVLLAGLGYEVAGALLLSLRCYWGSVEWLERADMVSAVAVWIVLFPLLVPAAPVRSGLAAVAAALTGPAVHTLWLARSGAEARPIDVARIAVPLLLAAALNVGVCCILHGLGRRLAAAEKRTRELGSYRVPTVSAREAWARSGAPSTVSPTHSK